MLKKTSRSAGWHDRVRRQAPTFSRSELLRRKFKTQLCMHFQNTGNCPFGDACDFAHGEEQLRSNHSNPQTSKATKHPLYKTAICRSILQGKECPYGSRCMFLHPEDVGFEAKMNEETTRRDRKNRHNHAQQPLQPQSLPYDQHISTTSHQLQSRNSFSQYSLGEKFFDADYRMSANENEITGSAENIPVGDHNPSEHQNTLYGYINQMIPTKENNRQENQNVNPIIADGVEPVNPDVSTIVPVETFRPPPLPILEDIGSEKSDTELWEKASPSALVAQYPFKDLFDRRANRSKTSCGVAPVGRSFFLQQLRTT